MTAKAQWWVIGDEPCQCTPVGDRPQDYDLETGPSCMTGRSQSVVKGETAEEAIENNRILVRMWAALTSGDVTIG